MADLHFSYINEQKLPLLLQAQNETQAHSHYLVQFLKKENTAFKEHLLKYGAVLLRGFRVDSIEKFLEIINACDLGSHNEYGICTIPRHKLAEGVYVFAEPFPGDIPVHNEKSYEHDFPTHMYFNCMHAAKTGGHTPLVDGHKLWLSLPEDIQYKLQSKGILYKRYYYGNSIRHKFIRALDKSLFCKTWMNAFQTNDKNEVERTLKKMGHQFKWTKKGDGLVTQITLPAVRNHPVTGKVVWFNQSNHSNGFLYHRDFIINSNIKNPFARFILMHMNILPYVAFYGDGQMISKLETDIINDTIARNTVSTAWQEGDVMVVDNYSCLHGKTAHTGSRTILVGLTKDQTHVN
ncbi:TauD/TfdA family dioxygenase [Legionella oakridgensis]|uniref:TauD/TfdA family dioxygenase n=1 Tax=Legionella oakridgensis TaxID=29423 RepID=UPI0003DE610E|nr:TauD/TfdA family dioxygenase [Legionella oakridgensis]ETO92397.1 taurine catabolism dioxygenase TauD, TfdA family [Legionella oakridgensis RV-2-2007]